MISTKVKLGVYWLATAYVIFLLGSAVVYYHTRHELIEGFFTAFGYPAYLIYPLATWRTPHISLIWSWP